MEEMEVSESDMDRSQEDLTLVSTEMEPSEKKRTRRKISFKVSSCGYCIIFFYKIVSVQIFVFF